MSHPEYFGIQFIQSLDGFEGYSADKSGRATVMSSSSSFVGQLTARSCSTSDIMNKLEKILLSGAAILSFGFYANFLRTQPGSIAATATSAQGNAKAQNTVDTSGAMSPAEFQTYLAQVNAQGQINQTAQQKADAEAQAAADAQAAAQEKLYAQMDAAAAAKARADAAAQAKADAEAKAAAAAAEAAANAKFRDGVFTGSDINVFYGHVEVEATIQNYKLTNVRFLQYPSVNSNSVRISKMAMPVLIQEAIAAQDSQVDGITGASATSEGFNTSLADALDQARLYHQ